MKKDRWISVLKRDLKNPFAILFLIVFISVSIVFLLGWKIAFETQSTVRCLPQTLWLIDPSVDNQALANGDLVQLDKQYMGNNHPAPEGTMLLKLVIASKGDRVVVKNNTLYVNDVYFGLLASQTYTPWVNGEYILKEDEIWLSGTTETTLDSRYFGPVKRTNIAGKAYAIL